MVGDSVPDFVGDDFQPKSAPSLLGDFGRFSERRLSSEFLRCTPSSCRFNAGEGSAPIMEGCSEVSMFSEEYWECVSMVARFGLGAWVSGCS